MKNTKLRNKLILILSLVFIASCALFVGNALASGNKFPYDPYENVTEKGGSSSSSVAIILSESTKIIPEFSEFTLTASVTGSREKITWSSSNESIVKVVSGKVSAVGQGTAEVRATIGTKTVACIVEVVASPLEPTLLIPTNALNLVNTEGSEYVMEVKLGWEGREVDPSNCDLGVKVEEGAEFVDVSINSDGKVVFTPKAEGNAIVSIIGTVYGKETYRAVYVSVVNEVMSFVPVDTKISSFINGGKFVASVDTESKTNLVDEKGAALSYNNTLNLAFNIARNGKSVGSATISWKYLNSNGQERTTMAGAKLEGDVLTISQAGEYNLIGHYEYLGKDDTPQTANVFLTVDSKLIDINLNAVDKNGNKAVIETSSVEKEAEKSYAYKIIPANFTYNVSGGVEDYEKGIRPSENTHVYLHGKEVASYNEDGQLIFAAKKDNLPLKATELGDQDLIIETASRRYHLPVSLYTLIISNKAELDLFRDLTKAAGESKNNAQKTFDGYFILDADVDYNGDFKSLTDTGVVYSANSNVFKDNWQNTAFYGFKGIFDGMGHSINGVNVKACELATECGGFFGYLHNDGIVRNLAFTNASIEENQALIAAVGGGLVENVYASFKKIGAIPGNNKNFGPNDLYEARPMGFYATSFCGSSARAVNCLIDVSSAEILFVETTRNDGTYLQNLCLGGIESVMNSVILICPVADYCKTSNANYSFAYYGAMDDENNGIDMKSWKESDFWTVEGNLIYCDAMKVDENISFNVKTGYDINIGGNLSLRTNLSYVNYELVDAQGYESKVHLVGSELTIDSDIPVGTLIKIKASDYFNASNTSEVTVTVRSAMESVALDNVVKFELGATISGTSLIHNAVNPVIDLSTISDKLGDNAYKVLIGKKVGNAIVSEKILDDVDILSNKITIDVDTIGFSYYGDAYLYIYTEKDNKSYEISVPLMIVTKVITTSEEFVNLAKVVALVENSGYYELGADITLGNGKGENIFTGGQWGDEPKFNDNRIMAIYNATIDGKGHTVSNMHLTATGVSSSTGWIHYAYATTIKNIAFTHISLFQGNNLAFLGTGASVFMENVYAQYDCVCLFEKSNDANTTLTPYYAGAYSAPTGLFVFGTTQSSGSTFKNIVLDFTAATEDNNARGLETSYYNIGSGGAGHIFGYTFTDTAMTNIVLLGIPEKRLSDGTVFRSNGGYTNGVDRGAYVEDYAGNTNGTAFPENGWDSAYWTVNTELDTISWGAAD